MALQIKYHRGGIHLPELGLWLDAAEPQSGPERVFVSHAHSDHTEAHREVIVSAPTAKLMQARIGGQRFEHVLAFGQATEFTTQDKTYRITLHPAGHIFGSAMSFIEFNGEGLLYTGDFKLRRGLSAEACEPRHADVLIMETTFGRPHYVFPPTDAVLKGVIQFCREALDNEETPVLLGYSLGKSQEIMCGLGEAGLPLMLHGAVHRLTQIYEQFGQCFPTYDRYEAGAARGKVLLCPPGVVNSAMLRNIGKTRCAILTGWAVDPNCRFRYRCDAAFPLSDHADFPDLVEMVKRVRPRKVYTLHGFAADFAGTLRELGFDAQALSENEQMLLPMVRDQPSSSRKPARDPGGRGAWNQHTERCREDDKRNAPVELREETVSTTETQRFLSFAETCAAIAETRSKLEKARLLAGYLRGHSDESVAFTAVWFAGRPFASSSNRVLQIGWAALRDALCAASGADPAAFHQAYLKHSDLGEAAFEILQARDVEPSLTIGDVQRYFGQLEVARGPTAKVPILANALRLCTALEAKFFVKIITGDLRIGLKEGLVEEAVAAAFSATADEVRKAHLVVGDIGETATLAASGRLSEAALVPFRPVKLMLASPEPTAADVWERVLHWHELAASERRSNSNSEPGSAVAWVEDKYDGVRCQLHKSGERVALYSRDLKEVTSTFLELADRLGTVKEDFVLDGEVVAMRGEQVLPFSELQKRLGRRERDLFMQEEVPIVYVAFDILWLNGRTCLNDPLAQRQDAFVRLRLPECFKLVHRTEVRSPAEIDLAFDGARARGNEGLMIKDPASLYLPGRRGLAWLKLKKAYATLDCVVIGAEYGHGKRSKVLSDYTFAVRDDGTGALRTIGKAYTGLTDVEIAELTQHFLSKGRRQHGRYFEVEPDTVLEIAFDRLQVSARHNSGLAMRFPRIVRIRRDKTVAEIDTLETARSLVS